MVRLRLCAAEQRLLMLPGVVSAAGDIRRDDGREADESRGEDTFCGLWLPGPTLEMRSSPVQHGRSPVALKPTSFSAMVFLRCRLAKLERFSPYVPGPGLSLLSGAVYG